MQYKVCKEDPFKIACLFQNTLLMVDNSDLILGANFCSLLHIDYYSQYPTPTYHFGAKQYTFIFFPVLTLSLSLSLSLSISLPTYIKRIFKQVIIQEKLQFRYSYQINGDLSSAQILVQMLLLRTDLEEHLNQIIIDIIRSQ